MGPIRRGALVVVLVLAFGLGAALASAIGEGDGSARAVVVPDGWQDAWAVGHVLEGDAVALAWGDLAGDDPASAPPHLRFDPEATLAQLEALHTLDVETLGLGAHDGPLAARKLLVVVEGTWSRGPGAAPQGPVPPADGGLSAAVDAVPPTHGAVVDGVGLLRVVPAVLPPQGAGGAAASPSTVAPRTTVPAGTSWELARGVAETVQHLTSAAHRGGPAPEAAASLRAAGSAYLATLAVPTRVADAADQVHAPQLAWGSSRLGASGWLLLQQLASRSTPTLLRDLWTRSLDTEQVLDAYARLTSSDAAALNRRVAQYALRAAVGDVGGAGAPGAVLADLDPVLLAHRTTPVDPVPDDPGHYRVLGTFAPAAYGYTVVRLAPDGTGDVTVRVRGHADALPGTDAGWSFGLVAVGPDGPRYSPVTETADAQLTFTPRDGEDELYLVVTATPATVAPTAPAGFASTARYPYEFRVAGAGVVDPTTLDVAGGHRHANGGGWVDDRATVDPDAWVGPGAVVRGDAVVGPGVRLEGRAWVQGGAELSGDVLVRDVAVVRPTARLSGTVVVGGDAVVGFACDAGTYTAYRAGAACDPASADTDVNPAVTPFAPGELVLDLPSPTSEPSPAPSATEEPAASTASPAPTSPPPSPAATTEPGVAAPPAAVPAGACTATYELLNAWPGGFQAQVVVTATAPDLRGWTVSWTRPGGVEMTDDTWGAAFTYSGDAVTADSLSWNGAVAQGQSVTFGFNAAAQDAPTGLPGLRCSRTG
jgi:hypothetical protein